MRSRLVLAMLITLPAVARAACAHDSAKAEPRTLFGQLGIKALHLDEAGGSAPLNGVNTSIGEGRVVFAHCRLPEYSIALVGGADIGWNETAYVAPGSADYHPELTVRWSGFEVTRRWRDSSIFHPMVSFATGTLTTEYSYSQRDANGQWHYSVDGTSRAPYYTPSVGLEASLFKYVSMYWMYGTRFVGTVSTPNVGRLSGSYSIVGFGFGKFR